MGLFRRAASPAVTVNSSSPHSSGSVHSGSSNSHDTPRSSTSHNSLPNDGAPTSSSGVSPGSSISLAVPFSTQKRSKADKGIAAGLLSTTQAAAPASLTVASAATSPWAGYLDPAKISTPATPKAVKTKKKAKRSGTLSAKKSTKKLKANEGAETDAEQAVDSDDLYEDDGQLETFFPMAKVKLEPLALPIATPSPALSNGGDAHKQLGYGHSQNGLLAVVENGGRGQKKESLGIARFSVGGMLDMVDQKMEKEEQDLLIQQEHKNIVKQRPTLLRPRFAEPAQYSLQRSPITASQSQRQVVPPSPQRGRTSPFPVQALSAASQARPSKSSQDVEEVLSPVSDHATSRAARRRTSSASSAASEATTLRDEVRELLAVARRAAAQPHVRDSIASVSTSARERQRTRSASEDSPRPLQTWQIVNSKVPASPAATSAVPVSPAPSKSATILRPHYGAFRAAFPSRKGDAVPVAPQSHGKLGPPTHLGHGRKRSMSVPSALQIAGYHPSFGTSLTEAVSSDNASDRKGLFPPKRYDESFFSSPKRALLPVRETDANSYIELESPAGSGASPTSMSLRNAVVQDSNSSDRRLHQEPARIAAGHPAPGNGHLVPSSMASRQDSPALQPLRTNDSKDKAKVTKEARSRSISDASVLDPYSPFERRQRALDRSVGAAAASALAPLSSTENPVRSGLPRSPKDRSLAARAAKVDDKVSRQWQSRLGEDHGLPIPKIRQNAPSRSSIGPPPRSPLPSLPGEAVDTSKVSPAGLPLPPSPLPPVFRPASPLPGSMTAVPLQGKDRLQARSPFPEIAMRAVSPTPGYSRENRPRPRNVALTSRTPSPLPPPTRPPPAPPLALPAREEGPGIQAEPLQINKTAGNGQRYGPAIQATRVRPDTQMTFDTIASYYTDEHESPSIMPPVPQSPYIRGSPQASSANSSRMMPYTPHMSAQPVFKSGNNVVRNVSSSSTLASSRPSMSMDGSHDTHVSVDSAITEEDGRADGNRIEEVRPSLDSSRGRFAWSRTSPPRKDSLPGRGLASALRQKAQQEEEERLRLERRGDEGYLGSPEQSETAQLQRDNPSAGRERISKEYAPYRSRVNYSVPIRHARHA